MPDPVPQAVDLWSVLEEAEQIVERWPVWMQRHDADIFYDGYPSRD